ncbi:Mitogen-activated protein kinase kinase kinase 20 [Linum perenne]
MAVKSAPKDHASSLVTEYQILRKFRGCPRVIQCIGDGFSSNQSDDDGETTTYYDLFLEYASGGSLSDLIANYSDGRGEYGIPETMVRFCTLSLLEAMDSIHSIGYTHCDVKPDNILVFLHPNDDQLFRVKIADFGLAMETTYSGRRSCRGTLRYMSPEVVISGNVSSAMDVWALGCTVLEMLTGKRPWEGSKKEEVMREIEKGVHPEIPEWLSEEGKDFVSNCFMGLSCRPPAYVLLSHPFITGMNKKKERLSNAPLLPHQMFQHQMAVLQC